jgi:hypothetical protein
VEDQSRLHRGSKSIGLDGKSLADALQLLGKHIQNPATIAAKETAPSAIQSITMALERADAEIGRSGLPSGVTDLSLTLYAARELERYFCGEKTQICNHHTAEIYYRVLCTGIEQIPQDRRDIDAKGLWSQTLG